MQEYEPEPGFESTDTPGAACPLFHLDAYRIGGPDDLASLGFDAALRPTGVSVVEWAARIDHALGPDVIHLALDHGPDGTHTLPHTLTLTARGRWAAQAQTLITHLAEPQP